MIIRDTIHEAGIDDHARANLQQPSGGDPIGGRFPLDTSHFYGVRLRRRSYHQGERRLLVRA